MAKSIQLKVSLRSGAGSAHAKRLRKEGVVPAVLYGKRAEPLTLQLGTRELRNALRGHEAEHLLVDLDLEGAKHLALLQDVQSCPLSGDVLHVDFHEINPDEKLTTTVVVEATGEPEGVKTGGGLLEHVLREITVSCLPKDLPERIVVDVSPLKLNDTLHLNDIQLPEGVTAAAGAANPVVFHVAQPKTEEAAPADPTAAEPEVLKEKKTEDKAAKPAAGKPAAAKPAAGKPAAKPAAKGK